MCIYIVNTEELLGLLPIIQTFIIAEMPTMGKFQRWLTASDLVITIISMDSSDEVGKLRKSGMSAATLYGKEEPGTDIAKKLGLL